MNFTSTDLAQLQNSSDTTAVQKADLDLLAKINQLGAVSTSVVSPLSSQIKSNTTYSLSNTVGITTVYIPVQFLAALVGGPFTLTLSCGTGTSVIVPIAAPGTTVSSGNLLFDVYCDGQGNMSSKDWSVSGSNSNGSFEQLSDGTMFMYGRTTIGATSGSSIAITLPGTGFIDTNYEVFPTFKQAGASIAGTSDTLVTAYTRTSFTVQRGNNSNLDSFTGLSWFAVGRWK